MKNTILIITTYKIENHLRFSKNIVNIRNRIRHGTV